MLPWYVLPINLYSNVLIIPIFWLVACYSAISLPIVFLNFYEQRNYRVDQQLRTVLTRCMWNVRNEVERSLITTILHIDGLVRDITLFSSVLSMHSEKLLVWCSSISSTCYYLLKIEGGGGGGGVTIKIND